MQELSDDEMRGLFSEKFANFEVTAKRGIWSKIDAGLSAVKRKSIARGAVYSTVALLTVASLTMYLTSERAGEVTGEKMVFNSKPMVHGVSVVPDDRRELEKNRTATHETVQHPVAHENVASSEPEVRSYSEDNYRAVHISEVYSLQLPALVFQRTLAVPQAIEPPRPKRNLQFVANVESFLNYKHTWVNRFDKAFQYDFNPGSATGLKRFGFGASIGAKFPFLSGNLEAGASLRQYRYSVSYTEHSSEVEQVKQVDFNNLGVGLWSDYYFTNKDKSFFAGVSWQTLIGTPGELRSQSMVATRVGYMFPLLSTERFSFVVKPVVTYNLTSLNFSTFRSRPYFFGVEVGLRTNR